MKKVIVLIAGKKKSGKNTLANQLVAGFVNFVFGKKMYSVDVAGEHSGSLRSADSGRILDITSGGPDGSIFTGHHLARIMSFADPLKQFCINVLGLEVSSCYGSDNDKNRLTHITWDGLPFGIRWKYARRRWWNPLTWLATRSGKMTGREVLQVYGTDIIRSWFSDAWVKAACSAALSASERLIIFSDARFPNELMETSLLEGKYHDLTVITVRLKRNVCHDTHISEVALDHIPDESFDFAIPEWVTVLDQEQIADSLILQNIIQHLECRSGCQSPA